MKERNLYPVLIKELDTQDYIIIAGARQTGKTTLLKMIEDYLHLEDKQVYSITLEDPMVLSLLNEHPENIFKIIDKPRKAKQFLLIDEVQYLKNPTNFLKFLYDKYAQKMKLIVTGSSAFYIDHKFKDSLAGRKRLFELHTLSFKEFIRFKDDDNKLLSEYEKIKQNKKTHSIRVHDLQAMLTEYITYGGYPAVVLAETVERKQIILKELTTSYLKRDVLESNVQQPEKFYMLLRILAQQTASMTNVHELANTTGMSVTAINNYLYILQKCYHIRLLKPFYRNIRKELTKMPKLFFNDLGFRNSLLNNFNSPDIRIDKGDLFENTVFLELIEQYGFDNLHYWRTAEGHEVDFVVSLSADKGFALETKYNISGYNEKKYLKFTEAYPQYSLNPIAFVNKNLQQSFFTI